MFFFLPLLSRACALPSDRERELRARPRLLKANAVAYEKTSRQRRRARQDELGVPPHRKTVFLGAENFTPCRVVLPLETAEDIHGHKQKGELG